MKSGSKTSGEVEQKLHFGGEISLRRGICQTTSADYTRDLSFREIIKSWLPVFLWMALMFFGSTDLMSAEHTSRF